MYNIDEYRRAVAENISKSFEDDLEKGKKANVGEIREWKGKKVQKQSDGTWKEIKKERQKKEAGEKTHKTTKTVMQQLQEAKETKVNSLTSLNETSKHFVEMILNSDKESYKIEKWERKGKPIGYRLVLDKEIFGDFGDIRIATKEENVTINDFKYEIIHAVVDSLSDF